MYPGGFVSEFYGVDSEVGRLRTVLLHRPGAELRRVTPERKCGMLFAALPWAERAQQEHDAFANTLRARGVMVLYVTELLQDALEYEAARRQAIECVLKDPRLGEELRGQLRTHLEALGPEELAQLLIMGMARDEFRGGRGAVFGLLDAWDYVIDPLPNLVFAGDIERVDRGQRGGDEPAGQARQRRNSPRSCSRTTRCSPGRSGCTSRGTNCSTGGDVLLLAPGVVAIGTGAQTSPAGMERLARRVFDSAFAHTVLAVLVDPGGSECLDTLCTLVGPDTVVMRPAVAYSLVARTITQRGDGLRLSHPQPFLEAAAQAMGIDRLRVIETGLGPGRAGRRRRWRPAVQWDDAGNLLALGPGAVVSYERNTLTNARLETAGIDVITVPGGELAGCRGGPRAICCPLGREPGGMPDER